MRDLPILIAGGGIAGFAAAIALARSGRAIRLFERNAAFGTEGAGLQASPNAVRALKAIGAWEAFAPHTYAPPAILIRDGVNGKILKRVALGKSFAETYGEPYRVAHRAHLHGALREVAAATPSIGCVTGTPVAAYRNESDRIIAVTSGGVEHAGCVLIGADGIHSAVRAQMLGDGPPVHRGLTLYRALVPLPQAIPDIDCVNLWLCPGGHVVHYPVDGGKLLNLVATAAQAAPAIAFKSCASRLHNVLANVSNWGEWPGAGLPPAPHWHDGRALLIGDAAHPALPFLAQGAAMALEDAAALPPLLDNPAGFEASRMARTTEIAARSRAMTRAYHAGGLKRIVRNLALSAMPPEAFIARLGWIYEYKPA